MSEQTEGGTRAFWGDVDDDVALQRYQTLVNTVDDGIYQLDASGKFVAVNDIIVEMCGYSREELLGEPVTLLLEDDDVERIGHDIYRHFKADERLEETYEFRARTADGETIPCELRVSLLVENGTFQGTVGVVRDISDQQEKSQALRESEQRFRSLVEAVEEYAIFMLDPDGQVVSWNDGAEQIKGYQADEILGQHFSTFYTDDDVQKGVPEENLTEARSDGVTEDEGWRVRADGSRFWANVTITAIRDDDGILQGFAKVTRDMTDQKRTREERRLQISVSRSVAEAPSLVDGLRAVLEDVCTWTEWEVGQAWIPSANGCAERLPASYVESERFADFEEASWNFTFDSGEGIPGRVLESREPVSFPDVSAVSGDVYPRTALAADAGLKAGLGVPVIADGEIAAVLEFYMSDAQSADDRLVGIVTSVAADLGSLVARKQVEDALEQERELLEKVMESAPVGISVLEPDGEIVRTNSRAQHLYDIGGDDSDLSNHDHVFLDQEEEPVALEERPFAQVVKTGESIHNWEGRLELPDAERKWLSINAAPILNDEGEVERVVTTSEDITQLKQQARYLERQRDDLKQELDEVFTRVDDAFYGLDTDWRFTYVNGQAEELLQHSEEELLGESFWEVFPEMAKEETVWDSLHTALNTQEQSSYEVYFESLGAWIEATVYPSETGVSVYFRDVTERKKREQQLEQHRAITEAVNDVIVTIDRESTIKSVNPAVTDMFGYQQEELVGASLTELMPDELVERHYRGFEQYLETGERTFDWDYIELPGEHADGSEIPLAISFSEVIYEGDQFFTGILRDVSDRRKRERQLERRARQQRVVAELGQHALESDDLDDLMHEAARQVADVLDNDYCKVLDLDRDAEELLLRQGVGWREGIVGTATVSSIEDRSQAAVTLANEEPIVVQDLASDDRISGPELLTSHDVCSGISTVIGSIEEPWGILGTHDADRQEFTPEDVNFVKSVANVLAEAIERERYQNELEQLVDDLEESNKRLEQFAYAASHDLQEPLRMVTSYLQLIEKRYDDVLDEDAREFLDFAVDGAERMRDMIDALLEYSRIETRGDPFEPVDLETVLEDTLEDLQIRIEETNAEVTADSLPRVYGDSDQLRQVFQNLLSNAIEYSGDAPPRVHISAAKEGGKWRIAVQDEGIGVDPDHVDRIFEVFQRLHTHDEHAGTGIGLALCRRIVERHGGIIRAESEPGEGSTFYFTLPASEEDA